MKKEFLLAALLILPLFYAENAPPAASSSKLEEDPSTKIVASVNGSPINLIQVQLRGKLILPQASYHGQISDEKIKEAMAEALNQLIIEELMHQEAKKAGISVSEKEINNRLKEIKKGYKSDEAFNKSLSANNLDINSFKRLIEKEIAIKRIKDKAFGKAISLSEAKVKDYYEKNKEKFREPEKIRLRQILIKVPPYASKEEWEKGRKKAEGILSQIKEGKEFAKLAKEFSDDPGREKGGDIGFIHKGRLEPYIESIAYSMKVGEMSDVLQTIYGYHIIKLEEKKPPEDIPFPKIKEKLKKDLEQLAIEEKQTEWVKELKEKADIKYYAPSDKKE